MSVCLLTNCAKGVAPGLRMWYEGGVYHVAGVAGTLHPGGARGRQRIAAAGTERGKGVLPPQPTVGSPCIAMG